jgi:hypothetical protein
MMGHSLALLLKQQQHSLINGDSSPAKEHMPGSKKPVIAIISPATSKGTSSNQLDTLALARSLLPSLYKTRSRLHTLYTHDIQIKSRYHSFFIFLLIQTEILNIESIYQLMKTMKFTRMKFSPPHYLMLFISPPKKSTMRYLIFPTIINFISACSCLHYTFANNNRHCVIPHLVSIQMLISLKLNISILPSPPMSSPLYRSQCFISC